MQNMNTYRPKAAPLQFDFGKTELKNEQKTVGQRQEYSQEYKESAGNAHSMPIKSFKSGAIQVSIWENETLGQDDMPKTYKTVSFDRRYKDKSGAWKSTNSLRVNDLPRAALILNKAYEYLILTESSDDENQ